MICTGRPNFVQEEKTEIEGKKGKELGKGKGRKQRELREGERGYGKEKRKGDREGEGIG